MAAKRRSTKRKPRAVKPWITAFIYRQDRGLRFEERVARINIDMTTGVPLVPLVIRVDGTYFLRTDTTPLRYSSVTFGVAKLATAIGADHSITVKATPRYSRTRKG